MVLPTSNSYGTLQEVTFQKQIFVSCFKIMLKEKTLKIIQFYRKMPIK